MDKTSRLTASLIISVLLGAMTASSGFSQERHHDLTQLSLEDLMNITVTSAGKKKEKLSEVTAAVYVLTHEDLLRSGATSIPEALRMVPGMQVARIDGNKWAISARGFNGSFANKLLVLIDGRSVYTPLFSGVFWDVQDVRLEDIERVEVIRGPGATLWGANAVNGVINIITKSARESQGASISTGAGSEEHRFGNAHYGGTIESTLHIRAYGKVFRRNHATELFGNGGQDRWTMSRGGFRMDWDAQPKTALTLQGDLYTGDLDQTVVLPILSPPYTTLVLDRARAEGGNVLGRMNHVFSTGSEAALQMYFDRTRRRDVLHAESRNTFDIELQHGIRAGDSHDIIWGLGYRLTSDQLSNSSTVMFRPLSHQNYLLSAFVQDEITLVPSEWTLTLGSKVERNDYTRFEVQPNARLLWKLHDGHVLWAAVSRAVRTPSRAENDVLINLTTFPTPTPLGTTTTVVTVMGSRSFRSEKLMAYEWGYRCQPLDRLSLDLALFYHDYRDLRTVEPAGPPTLVQALPVPYLVSPLQFGNQMDGETYGAELASTWQPSDSWKVQANYTWLKAHLRTRSGSGDSSSPLAEGDDPQHKIHLRSYATVFERLDLDVALYHVGSLRNQNIAAYTRVDGRIGWHITSHLQFHLVGQNLLDDKHQEFGNTPLGVLATMMPRSVYGRVAIRL